MYVFVPPPPPSPEAEDLGAKVAQLVRMLRQENPNLSAIDIRRGLEVAGLSVVLAGSRDQRAEADKERYGG